MKKSIIIISLAIGFFFTSTNYVTAQWCFNVTYTDTLCDCGTITQKTVEYSIYDVVTQQYIVNDNDPLPNENPFELSGNESINYDAQNRYYVAVRITYFDPTQCCTGWNYQLMDGDELVDCTETITIIME